MPTASTAVPLSVYLSGFERHGRAYLLEGTGEMHLTLPERMGYIDLDGVTEHPSTGQDTVIHLAVRYYGRVYHRSAASLYKVIAEFQPVPIINPFAPIPQGRVVLIPPPAWVETMRQGESLADYPEI